MRYYKFKKKKLFHYHLRFYSCFVVILDIECCTFIPFEDSRCYLELVNGQYIVRSNPHGSHMDFIHCVLVNGAVHTHSVHRQGEITLLFPPSLISYSGNYSEILEIMIFNMNCLLSFVF